MYILVFMLFQHIVTGLVKIVSYICFYLLLLRIKLLNLKTIFYIALHRFLKGNSLKISEKAFKKAFRN